LYAGCKRETRYSGGGFVGSRWSSGLSEGNWNGAKRSGSSWVQIPPPALFTEPPRVVPVGEVVSFGLWMRKQGYRESTTHYCIQALESVAGRANLLDPESAKTYLSSAKMSEARKAKLAEDLARTPRFWQLRRLVRPSCFVQERKNRTYRWVAFRVLRIFLRTSRYVNPYSFAGSI